MGCACSRSMLYICYCDSYAYPSELLYWYWGNRAIAQAYHMDTHNENFITTKQHKIVCIFRGCSVHQLHCRLFRNISGNIYQLETLCHLNRIKKKRSLIGWWQCCQPIILLIAKVALAYMDFKVLTNDNGLRKRLPGPILPFQSKYRATLHWKLNVKCVCWHQ